MALRLFAIALVVSAILAATPGLTDPVEVPFLTSDELRCQRNTVSATVSYLRRVFAARQACFDKVTREALPQEVDCRAAADEGTGDDGTDDSISAAEAALAVAIQTTCLNVELERLAFPGLCPDPFGPPYDTFDHEQCLLERSNQMIDRLLDIEHPPFPGKLQTEDHNCQDEIGVKSSTMVVNEIEDRTTGCEQKRLQLRVEEDVNCRNEIDPLAPGTGDTSVDNNIVDAHERVLRGIANACGFADLQRLGFPHRCPNPDDSLFSIAALSECMYETHHDGLIHFIDTLIPLTKLCGNCLLDGDTGERCDDGDNEWEPGQICQIDCSLAGSCGDPDDSGGVTIRDALFILRAAVGLERCDLALCDINGDGVINTTDALLALRAVVGLPVEFACNPPDPETLVCPVP